MSKNLNGTKLLQHFNKAVAAGREYPKITVKYGERKLLVYRQGSASINCGGLAFTNGGGYGAGDSKYYGRISVSGRVDLKDHYMIADPELLKTITKLLDDPVMFAAVTGRMTGCCIFCARQLTDPSSVHHGYGPTCADNFGLPWGELPPSDGDLLKDFF